MSIVAELTSHIQTEAISSLRLTVSIVLDLGLNFSAIRNLNFPYFFKKSQVVFKNGFNSITNTSGIRNFKFLLKMLKVIYKSHFEIFLKKQQNK